jgi:DNA-binding MarR family transcriptional regulator
MLFKPCSRKGQIHCSSSSERSGWSRLHWHASSFKSAPLQICISATAESTAKADLTPQEFAVTTNLNKAVGEPDIGQSDLAARLGIDMPTRASRWIVSNRGGCSNAAVRGEDQRARLVRLTPRGEKLHGRPYPEAFAGQHRILEMLELSEREALLDLLVRVIEGNRHLARPGRRTS